LELSAAEVKRSQPQTVLMSSRAGYNQPDAAVADSVQSMMEERPNEYTGFVSGAWLPSLGRITVGVLGGLALALGALFLLLRQPNFGSSATRPEARADPERLRLHVESLSVDFAPRTVYHPENLERAADYIGRELGLRSDRTRRQAYLARGQTFANVLATFGPDGVEDRADCWVVGAHYDSFGLTGPNPGADDNASGVAGLLELARLLAEDPPGVRVELVAYSTEEPPYFASASMGSAHHALQPDCDVQAMISLEMIGYYSDTQPYPHWLLGLLYPRQGDFVAVVGRLQDRQLARQVKRAMRGASAIEVYSVTGPFGAGLENSDQMSYWRAGIPAVMVTDTAIRNPNYHTEGDRADTLDYEAMAEVVEGVLNAALTFGSGQ